jgi:preprotein translocase subunit YajC
MSFLPMLIILVIIYFFFLRPQATKQKEQLKFQNELAIGDKVVTASGIIGKITRVEGNEVVIESEKTSLRMTHTAISKELTDSLKK